MKSSLALDVSAARRALLVSVLAGLGRAPGALVVVALLFGVAARASAAPMQVSGKHVLDSCGNVFVARGVEQILGAELPPGNDWLGLIQQLSESGVNAVRILPGVSTLSVGDVDDVLTLIGNRHMVAYIGPLSDDGTWFGRADVRDMLARHESYIILDAYGEPQYDDRERFLSEAKQAIQRFRNWGYRVPLTVTGNQFGRDLPSVLQFGAEISGSDPLSNTILGWQAYWGSGGYYQSHYGLSLNEAVSAIAAASFPIQMGLDHVTDPPSETADFGTLMSLAEANGIGWLWWDWYNPYGSENDLSRDGSAGSLTATGSSVIDTHAASVKKTARLVCSTAPPPSSPPAVPPAPPAVPPAPPAVPPAPARIAIDAGGVGSGSFVADQSFKSGHEAPRSSAAIDRSLIPAPAPPEAVYQTERWGGMTYRIAGFEPFSVHTVELHFAEIHFRAPGQRKFNVRLNDVRVLDEYDIVAAAGAPNKAVREVFSTTATYAGEIVIRFVVGSVDQPDISAIVIQ